MERDKIIMLLCAQNYPEYMLEQTADKVERLPHELSEALEEWADCGKEPDLEIQGYSYARLVKEYDMRPIGAFLTLDWLRREPEKAVAALKRGIRKIKK